MSLPMSGWYDCEQKCECREPDRLLEGGFMGGQNEDTITDEILREVTILENMEEATSECVLSWMCRKRCKGLTEAH